MPQRSVTGPAESASKQVTIAQATSHSFPDGLEFTNATDITVTVEYVNIETVTANQTTAEEIAILLIETTHLELTEMRKTSNNPMLEDNIPGTQHSELIASLLSNVVDQVLCPSHGKALHK